MSDNGIVVLVEASMTGLLLGGMIILSFVAGVLAGNIGLEILI